MIQICRQKLWKIYLNKLLTKSQRFSTKTLSYIHKIGKKPLVYRTIGQELDLIADKYGDRLGIVSCHERKSYTFAEIADRANRLATSFHKIGLKPGDCIGIWLANTCNWYITFMAAAKAGLISVGLNPAFQSPEIAYCIKKVDMKAILTTNTFKTQNYYEMLTTLVPEIKTLTNRSALKSTEFNSLSTIIIDSDQRFLGTFQLNEIYEMSTKDDVNSAKILQKQISPDNPCNIQFTSGTTGLPKAVLFSHFNNVNNGIHLGYRTELFNKHHKICSQTPFFHASGTIVTIMSALSYGATVVIPAPSFNAVDSLKAIESEQCTITLAVPTMYIDMIGKQRELQKSINSWECAVVGGAPCSPQLLQDIKTILRIKKIKHIYGLTEATGVAFASLHSETDEKIHKTDGHIMDHLEAKIINENGKTVEMGEPGELCLRGYSTMIEYLNDEQKTRETIGRDKWLKTGDQFILQETGYGKVVGRLKDMIIRGGENLSPVEIENLLHTNPNIAEVYVIGVPDERMGEELCAYIRLEPNVSEHITVDEIKQFCKATFSPRPSYIHNVGKNPLVYRTIGQELDIAVEKYGDREAIVSCYENQRYTFADIAQKVNCLAAAFHNIGLNPGDCIGIWLPNSCNWYITFMAAVKAGLITVGLNAAFQPPEIAYCIKKIGIKAILTISAFKTQNYYEMLATLIPEIKTLTKGTLLKSSEFNTLTTIIIDSDEHFPGTYQLKEIYEMPTKSDEKFIENLQENMSPDSPCNIQFSSGTTGFPKAAVLTHYKFVNSGLNIGYTEELFRKPHKICAMIPFFHVSGIAVTIMPALSYGATIIIPGPSFNPVETLNAIESEKCTQAHAVPTMYIDLIAKQRELKKSINSFEYAPIGGSPCPVQLFNDIKTVLGVEKVKNQYGLSEATGTIFASLHTETEEQVTATVGHILDHLEAKIIDSNGKIVPMGEPGELCIRGYCAMLEYLNDDEKTRETLGKDGWLRTGDLFTLYENGYGKYVGRVKDMIIRGGENIFPVEIENFLQTNPNILEAYIIGVADERLGEELCAYVRLNPNGKHAISVEQIKEFCKGKLAHFKIPKYIKIVESLPRTQSGKIQKFKLKEMFENDLEINGI